MLARVGRSLSFECFGCLQELNLLFFLKSSDGSFPVTLRYLNHLFGALCSLVFRFWVLRSSSCSAVRFGSCRVGVVVLFKTELKALEE